MILAGSITAILLAEILVAVTDSDIRILHEMRYTVEGDFDYLSGGQVYRRSDDPELLFETCPGAQVSCAGCTHPAEVAYRTVDITLNSRGLRNREFPLERAAGVTRILALGGSNTFGPSVHDDDTWPAQVQRVLDGRSPGRFEVYNAGRNAYVMSQKARLLEVLAEEIEPDLVLIQDYNQGRRAFYFEDADYRGHFERNPDLFEENLPWLWDDAEDGRPRSLHRLLILQSGVYRVVYGTWFQSRIARRTGRVEEGDLSAESAAFPTGAAERIGVEKFAEVVSELAVPVVVLSQMDEYRAEESVLAADGRMGSFPHVQYARLRLPDGLTDAEVEVWGHLHPPSHVYSWYADYIVDRIIIEIAR
jgi:hypothetical protein